MAHYVIREVKYVVDGLEILVDYSDDGIMQSNHFTIVIDSSETSNSLRSKVRYAIEERAGSGAPWPDVIIYGLDTI